MPASTQSPAPAGGGALNGLSFIHDAATSALVAAGPHWCPETDLEITQHGDPQILKVYSLGAKRIAVSLNESLATRLMADRSVRSGRLRPDDISKLESATFAATLLQTGFYDRCPMSRRRHKALVAAAFRGGYGQLQPTRWRLICAEAVAVFFERCVAICGLLPQAGAPLLTGLARQRALNNWSEHLLYALELRIVRLYNPWIAAQAFRSFSVPQHAHADTLLPRVRPHLFQHERLSSPAMWGRKRRQWRLPGWNSWDYRVSRLAGLLIQFIDEYGGNGPIGMPAPHGLPVSGVPGWMSEYLSQWPFPDAADDGPTPGRHPGSSTRHGAGRLPGAWNEPPERLLDFEQLDQYYTAEATALVIRQPKDDDDSPFDDEPDLMEAGYLAAEPVRRFGDLLQSRWDFSQIRFARPHEGDEEDLILFRKTEPLMLPIAPIESHPAPGVPSVLFVVDSSGSMKFHPQNDGDARGQYDLVLRACYGVLAHMANSSAVSNLEVCAINFSDYTVTSGWCPAHAPTPAKKTLCRWQGKNTTLDVRVLQEQVTAQSKNFVTLLMTDGEVTNHGQVIESFRRLIELKRQVIQLHIGKRNRFTDDMASVGAQVHVLNKAGDLVDLCMAFARATFTEGSPPPESGGNSA